MPALITAYSRMNCKQRRKCHSCLSKSPFCFLCGPLKCRNTAVRTASSSVCKMMLVVKYRPEWSNVVLCWQSLPPQALGTVPYLSGNDAVYKSHAAAVCFPCVWTSRTVRMRGDPRLKTQQSVARSWRGRSRSKRLAVRLRGSRFVRTRRCNGSDNTIWVHNFVTVFVYRV